MQKTTVGQKWPLHRGIRRASGSPPPSRNVGADKAGNSAMLINKQVWDELYQFPITSNKP